MIFHRGVLTSALASAAWAAWAAWATCALWGTGCATNYPNDSSGRFSEIIERQYYTDFNTAWEAVKTALKSAPIDVDNRDGGFLQTKWIDNTSEKNFVDSFGDADTVLKAQYRMRITVAKGSRLGRPAIKISIQKEQLVQKDVLEGWRKVETDTVGENTFLYRIGRLILMKMKIARLEDAKAKQAIENVKF